ncbi:cation diffusion facilitator family transporter [Sneathiella sp.]|jgi:ferrous-iron efflux pump FieF|uniref:cation diffusion facilitator family transporter n=1 Tax=Sneathiella sp. TaxID=1964365 RepID=UPI0039E5DDB0
MTSQAEKNSSLMRFATYAAVFVAISLIAVKSWAYIATDSVSILSTLVDSVLDLGASIVNLLAVRHALTPADDEHRFGHGKAEALAGLFQSAFIVGSAIFLLLQAAERLVHPQPIQAGWVGIGVMIASIVLTLFLVVFQRFVIRQTKSVAISADYLHYAGDLLVNASVILAIILSAQLGWIMADGVFAIGIAIYISYNAWSIIRMSFADLMDEELPEEDRQQIIDLVLTQKSVMGVHELRTRRSGQKVFIQMHIDLPASLNLQEAHEISETVEMEVLKLYPDAEAIIHQDPYPAATP